VSRAQDACLGVDSVCIVGNHQTLNRIFYRELNWEPGQCMPVSDSLLARFEGRLQSTHLFTEVSLQVDGRILRINVRERWYAWARPIAGYGDGSLVNWAQSGFDTRRLFGGAEFHLNNIGGLNRDLRVTGVGGFNRAAGVSFRRPYTHSERDYQWSIQSEHVQSSNIWFMSQNNQVRFYPDAHVQLKQSTQLGAEFRYRFNYHKDIRLQSSSQWLAVDTAILRLNPNYTLGAARQYQQRLGLAWVRDYRNQLHYPTQGSEWKTTVAVYGQWSGEAQRFTPELESRYRVFLPLNPQSGFAALAFFRYRMGDLTYMLQNQAFFQGDYVRGYENYMFDGQGLALAKLAYRHQLGLTPTVQWPFKVLGAYRQMPVQAWLNVYTDAGKILKPIGLATNPLAENMLHSVGLGVDLLLYYDALLRFDFSRNARGEWVSRLVFRHAI
jgi:outer membrane protein assembly factor BamA